MKELMEELPKNFVKVLVNIEAKAIIHTEYQDFQLKPDFVLELINGSILHVEFQSTNYNMMPYRMIQYYSIIKSTFADRNTI